MAQHSKVMIDGQEWEDDSIALGGLHTIVEGVMIYAVPRSPDEDLNAFRYEVGVAAYGLVQPRRNTEWPSDVKLEFPTKLTCTIQGISQAARKLGSFAALTRKRVEAIIPKVK